MFFRPNFFRTDAELKEAYANQLNAAGRSVSVDVPVGDRGTVDILTDTEIIFCTLALDAKSAIALKSKLDFYGHFSPSWAKVVVVQRILDANATTILENSNITVININEETGDQQNITSSQRPPSQTPYSSSSVSQQPRASKLSASSVPRPTTAQQITAQNLDSEHIIYRYPKLDSVQGGDGIKAALAALSFVFLLGIAITLIQ